MDGGSFIPAYDSIIGEHNQATSAEVAPVIRVSTAESPNDLAMAFAIRASVFLAEPNCRFKDEFDTNEYVCSHLLVWIGDEPVGTLRLRWFADFARFERITIRPQYRSLKVFRALVRYAMRLCAAKGYRYVVGLSRPAGVRFWKRFGGHVVGQPITYHGETLFPMRYELPDSAHPAIRLGAMGAGVPFFEDTLGLPESELAA